MPLADPLPSDESGALVRAIEETAERLRGGSLSPEDAVAAGESVLSYARHERSNVRKAVAEAARHLPDESFEAAITILLADSSDFVKNAAKRSYDARSRRTRVERAQKVASSEIRDLRARIAREFKPAGARAADRLSRLELAQFVERLDHELAKPAQALKVVLGGLCDDARLAGDASEVRARVMEARAMLDVLMGIAQTARVHAQVVKPKFQEENLRAVVLDLVAILRARIGAARQARLRLEVDIDEAITVEIDRGLFGQAVTNLLQNAVEAYSVDGDGAIHVHVVGEMRKPGTRVALVVTDRGCGIREDSLAKMGEPYMSSKGGGRGLGFLNVKTMIEAVHGGEVEVTSRWGEGTRIALVVPRKQ